MKKILLIVAANVSSLMLAHATLVHFPFISKTGSPVNAQFQLQSSTNLYVSGSNLVVGNTLYITSVPGGVTTNLIPDTYTMSIVGVSGYLKLGVPDSTNPLEVVDLLTNLPVPVPATFPGVIQLLAGSGVTLSPTNGQGVVTLNASAGGSAFPNTIVLTTNNPTSLDTNELRTLGIFTNPVPALTIFNRIYTNAEPGLYWAALDGGYYVTNVLTPTPYQTADGSTNIVDGWVFVSIYGPTLMATNDLGTNAASPFQGNWMGLNGDAPGPFLVLYTNEIFLSNNPALNAPFVGAALHWNGVNLIWQ